MRNEKWWSGASNIEAPRRFYMARIAPSFLWKEVPVGRRLDDAKHRKIDFADLNWNERYLISNP